MTTGRTGFSEGTAASSQRQSRWPRDPSRRIPYCEQILGGELDLLDVIQPIYGEIDKQYGTNEKPGGRGRASPRSQRNAGVGPHGKGNRSRASPCD